MERLKYIEPVFDSVLHKQCFYVNLYNSAILFKLAEICVIKQMQIFNVKNKNQWLAIEHNSFLMINKVKYSAYQLKKMVMNLPEREHLISMAFFLPKGGNLRL